MERPDTKCRDAKGAKDGPLHKKLQVLEEVGDFLAGFFGVIDCDVLTLLGAEGGIAANGFAGIHGGMLGNFEGFLRAVGGLHGDDFRALADVFDGAFRGMDGFIAEPLNGMGSLFRSFASRVDDDVPAFFADEVGALGAILQAGDSGFLGELDRFDGAVGGLYGNRFRAGIDFFDGASDDMSGILRAGYSNGEARCEEHGDYPKPGLKQTGLHRLSLECGDWEQHLSSIEKC
jgi:hypothetical protein